MHRLTLLTLLLGLVQSASSQVATTGPRLAAFGGAGVALTGEPWALANPAAAASLSRPHVAVFASQAFGMPELRQGAGIISHSIGRWRVAAHGSSFGDSDYRETESSISIATPLFRDTRLLDVGVRVAHRRVRISGFGAVGLSYMNVGWLAEALPGFHVAGAVENLFESRWTEIDRIPRIMRTGLRLAPSESTVLALDIIKDGNHSWSGSGGVQIRLVPAFAFRVGGATGPDVLSLGCEISTGGVVIDLLAERHDELGWSPGIGTVITW